MGFEIKPEDISAELKSLFYKAIDLYPPKDAPAVWLNVAIQNGLVSPPLWVVERIHDKNLSSGLFATKAEAERVARDLHPDYYRVVHYKGGRFND